MAEFNYLVASLQSIEEGEGTLLDHCAIIGTSEISFGRTHSLEDMPLLTAGSAGGTLKQGLHHHAPRRKCVPIHDDDYPKPWFVDSFIWTRRGTRHHRAFWPSYLNLVGTQ